MQEANVLFWVLFSEIKALRNSLLLLERCDEITERLCFSNLTWGGHFLQTRQNVGSAYCIWRIRTNIKTAGTVQISVSNLDKRANYQVLEFRSIPQLLHANDIAYVNWSRMIHPKFSYNVLTFRRLTSTIVDVPHR